MDTSITCLFSYFSPYNLLLNTSFQNSAGQTAQIECPTGRFTTTEANSICTTCSPGSYQKLTAQTGCTNCPGGWYQHQSEMVECYTCDAGTFYTSTSVSCSTCPDGYYQSSNTAVSAVCTLCIAGKEFTSKTQDCAICATGKYQHENARPAALANFVLQGILLLQKSTACQTCPKGRYQGSNSAASAACSDCASGRSSLIAKASCAECQSGYANEIRKATCSQLYFASQNKLMENAAGNEWSAFMADSGAATKTIAVLATKHEPNAMPSCYTPVYTVLEDVRVDGCNKDLGSQWFTISGDSLQTVVNIDYEMQELDSCFSRNRADVGFKERAVQVHIQSCSSACNGDDSVYNYCVDEWLKVKLGDINEKRWECPTRSILLQASLLMALHC